MRKVVIGMLLLLLSMPVLAVDLVQTGVWSDEETDFQGIVVVPVPETGEVDRSIVLYWFTYDEDGNQAWLVSDTIPADGSSVEFNWYKPIGFFASTDAEAGEVVGAGRLLNVMDDSMILRFALSTTLDGYSTACSANISGIVLPAPAPPPLPDEYECRGGFDLQRVSPLVEALR